MKNLILKKGLSYSMKGFSCTRGNPVSVEDDVATILLATGRFEEGGTPDAPETEKSKDVSAEDITKMKKDELIEFAEAHDIDIADCSNNDERIARIQGALGLASFAQMGLED
jgi:hypothetical protein